MSTEFRYAELVELLEARVEVLGRALKRYGQHDDDCRTVNANVPESSCNCGFYRLSTSQSPAEEPSR